MHKSRRKYYSRGECADTTANGGAEGSRGTGTTPWKPGEAARSKGSAESPRVAGSKGAGG